MTSNPILRLLPYPRGEDTNKLTDFKGRTYEDRVAHLRRNAGEIIAQCMSLTPETRGSYLERILVKQTHVPKPSRTVFYITQTDGEKYQRVTQKPLMFRAFYDIIAPFCAEHYSDLPGRRTDLVQRIRNAMLNSGEELEALRINVERVEGIEGWKPLKALDEFLTVERYKEYIEVVLNYINN
jgi:hypothetical protein